MKVSEILIEGREEDYDEVRERKREWFDDNYVPASGVISLHPEDIQYYMERAKGANFAQEQQVVDRMMDMDIDDMYLPNNDNLHAKLEQAEHDINTAKRPAGLIYSIKEYLRMLSSSLTTFDAWENSSEGKQVEDEEFARIQNPD